MSFRRYGPLVLRVNSLNGTLLHHHLNLSSCISLHLSKPFLQFIFQVGMMISSCSLLILGPENNVCLVNEYSVLLSSAWLILTKYPVSQCYSYHKPSASILFLPHTQCPSVILTTYPVPWCYSHLIHNAFMFYIPCTQGLHDILNNYPVPSFYFYQILSASILFHVFNASMIFYPHT